MVLDFDLDTAGYIYSTPDQIQTSKNRWDSAINPSNKAVDNFLQIEHDIQYQTVYNLTDYILASLSSHGYRAVTVGDCLADPQANWYRAAGSAVPTGTTTSTGSTPTDTGKTVSVDGNCGGTITCQGSTFGKYATPTYVLFSSRYYCRAGARVIIRHSSRLWSQREARLLTCIAVVPNMDIVEALRPTVVLGYETFPFLLPSGLLSLVV
jgi:hypothetical protein